MTPQKHGINASRRIWRRKIGSRFVDQIARNAEVDLCSKKNNETKDVRNGEVEEKTNVDFDVKKWLEYFSEEGKKKLILGHDLKRKLISTNEPYEIGEEFLHGNRIFLIWLWDQFVQVMYQETNGRPTPEVELSLCSFLREIEDVGEEFNASLFGEFVIWINKTGITKIVRCNWYDLPAATRLMAPLTNTICGEFASKKYWMREVLRGLPFSVLMMPWSECNLGRINLLAGDKKIVRP